MNKLILKILPKIEQVANHATTNHDFKHEITQTLILKCYDNEDAVKEMYEGGGLNGWLYQTSRNYIIDTHRAKKFVSLTTDVKQIETETSPIDYIKTLDQMLQELTHVERIWIDLYIDCNFNISELNRRSTVCRKASTERIEAILKRWKQLDIYLPQ